MLKRYKFKSKKNLINDQNLNYDHSFSRFENRVQNIRALMQKNIV